MSKCQKLGFSTNYRFSKMHCLEYCYCLITITIISVLIVIIIIYHHDYHHYYDYYYHHHCYHQNRYPHLEYHYLKYYLEYNSGNKLVFIRTFRKLFTNLTQKVMSTPKNWDKKQLWDRNQLYPSWQNRDKENFLWLLQIHNYLLSQPAKPQRKT